MNLFGPVDLPAPSSSPPIQPIASATVPAVASPPSTPSGFFDVFKVVGSPQSHASEPPARADVDSVSYDEEYDDLDKDFKRPSKPNIVRDGDVKSKKFDFPSDEISIIEY